MPPYIERVLSKFEGVRVLGDGSWKALCPAHEDSDPSLHISVGDGGFLVMKCHAGCEIKKVVYSAGLEMKDLICPTGQAPEDTHGKNTPAPADVKRFEVYAGLVNHLTLTPEDRESLRARGLSDEFIGWAQYRSLRVVDTGRACRKLVEQFGEDTLLTVPGFRRKEAGGVELICRHGLLIPVRDHLHNIHGFQVRTGDGRSKYIWLSGSGSPSVGSPVHFVNEAQAPSPPFIVTEGPLKADVVANLWLPRGAIVFGIPGVSTWQALTFPPTMEPPDKVFLGFDSDWKVNPSVRAAVRGLALKLAENEITPVLLDWPSEYKGLDDCLKAGVIPLHIHGAQAVLDATGKTSETVSGGYGHGQAVETVPVEGVDDGTPHIVVAGGLEAKPIEWLWPGYIPFHGVSITDGDPGLGKSTFTLDLVARVTLGLEMPPANHPKQVREPGKVLLMSAEDDPERVINPRLEVHGANLSNVGYLEGVWYDKQVQSVFLSGGSANDISLAVKSFGASLLVVDPFTAYLSGEVDSHKDQSVRAVLRQLSRVAKETGCAIHLVRHLNKTALSNPLYRGLGGIGIVGACRVGLLVTPHPEESDCRVLSCQKSNWGPIPRSLVYTFVQEEGQPVAKIEWKGTTYLTAADCLNGREISPRVEKGIVFLEKQLKDQTHSFEELQRLGAKAGLSSKTIREAGDVLRVCIRRVTQDGVSRYLWSLQKGVS